MRARTITACSERGCDCCFRLGRGGNRLGEAVRERKRTISRSVEERSGDVSARRFGGEVMLTRVLMASRNCEADKLCGNTWKRVSI